MSDPLRRYGRRVEASLSPAQRALVRQREAERLGVNPAGWTALRDARFDLVLLRDAHRMIAARSDPPGQRQTSQREPGARPVRRAGPDGRWHVSAARPGKLRSQPQSFRIGDHIEPAWDHNTLTRRLAALLNTTHAAIADDPIIPIASFVWTLVRAQPFLGSNERTSLTLAARLLSAADLPVPHVDAIDADPSFTAALIAPTPDPLAAYLTRVVWDEALAFAQWLAIPSPADATRWTLAHEHAALEAARARIATVEPAALAAIIDHATAVLVPLLAAHFEMTPPAATSILAATFADRMRVALDSAPRGRHLCPHRPLHHVRWSLDAGGLGAVLVAGTAGRGLTGAAVIHLALDPPAIAYPAGHGLLIVPDEAATDQRRRLAVWAPLAVQGLIGRTRPR